MMGLINSFACNALHAVVDELSGIFPEAPKLFGFQVERFDDADARQQFHQHRVLQHVGPAPEAAGLARLFAEDEQWKENRAAE